MKMPASVPVFVCVENCVCLSIFSDCAMSHEIVHNQSISVPSRHLFQHQGQRKVTAVVLLPPCTVCSSILTNVQVNQGPIRQ